MGMQFLLTELLRCETRAMYRLRRLRTERSRESAPPARPNGPAAGTCLSSDRRSNCCRTGNSISCRAPRCWHAALLDVPHEEGHDVGMQRPLMCDMQTFSMSKIEEIGHVDASCMRSSMKRGAKSLRKSFRKATELLELPEKDGKGMQPLSTPHAGTSRSSCGTSRPHFFLRKSENREVAGGEQLEKLENALQNDKEIIVNERCWPNKSACSATRPRFSDTKILKITVATP